MPEAGYEVKRKLCSIVQLRIRMETVTGLLVRRPSKAQMTIGGADLWPMTLEMMYECGGEGINVEVPYIPGSSIKGRMRFIAEHSTNSQLFTTDFKIFQHVRNIKAFQKVYGDKDPRAYEEFLNDIENRCVIDEVFGYASFQLAAFQQEVHSNLGGGNNSIVEKMERLFKDVLAPTRLYVDDFYVDEKYVCGLKEKLGRYPFLYDFLEEKSENRIDRLTSAADPRDVVRVRAGIPFVGNLKLLVFDVDADKCPGSNDTCVERNLEFIASVLKALQKLGLGASVSRGYGRVKIEVDKVCIARALKFDETCMDNIKSLDQLGSKAKEIAKEALKDCKSGGD